jgi:NADH-quinone oxidoreductase subunit L
MTALYMGRVLLRAFFGEPSKKAEHAHESGGSMTGPLIVLAIPSLLAGYAGAQLAGVTGAHYELHVGATPILASLLGLAGLGLAYVLHRRGGEEPAVIATIARIAKTSAVNRVYEAAFHHGFTPTSRALGWVDRYLVDGVINAIGERTLRAGAVLRRVQTGDAQDYVLAVVAGVIALIAIGWAI